VNRLNTFLTKLVFPHPETPVMANPLQFY